MPRAVARAPRAIASATVLPSAVELAALLAAPAAPREQHLHGATRVGARHEAVHQRLHDVAEHGAQQRSSAPLSKP
jgi:hypothetical protein